MPIADDLYPFQREAVEFAASRPGAALLCEQGTGKTFVLAALVERLARQSERSAHLVVAILANVETTWERVLARLEGVSVHRDWVSFRDSTALHRVLLTHYEAFRGSVVRRIVKRHWTSATFDESQRLKKRSSKASRAAARFTDVDHRVILTGTPIEQSPQDLWAQLRFVAPDVLGRRWTDFADRWLRRCGYMGYDYKFRDELLPKFIRTVRPVVFRVTRAQVLDLPPVARVVETVPLLGEQARVYREIDRHKTTVLVDGRTVVCDLAITERVRLRQVTSGFIRTADGDVARVGDAKTRRLRVVLAREHRAHGPVVVFCNYREEMETCARVAAETIPGCRVRFLRGGRGSRKRRGRERAAAVDAFQAGLVDVLVCQVRAGGVGVDLFRGCVAVFFSLPDSSIDFEQAVSRLLRNGQTRVVRIVSIQAANTVDTSVASDLLSKRSVSQKVLEDHRRTKMAKSEVKKEAPKKEAAASEKKTPTPPPQPPKPKYGVPELAEAMGVKATSLRVRLRSAKIPKKGKLYGWDTKSEMQTVIDALKASASKKKSSAPKKAAEADDGDENEETDGD